MFKRSRKLLILVLSILLIAIVTAIYFVIRINTNQLQNAVLSLELQNPVSEPISYIAPIVKEESKSEVKLEEPTINFEPIAQIPDIPKVEPLKVIPPDPNKTSDYQPPFLPYEDNPTCTPDQKVFEAKIFTNSPYGIHKGEKGNIYADTMHNCTNPNYINKTWKNGSTDQVMSYTTQVDLSGLEPGTYDLIYATWNDEFYSEASITVLVW